VTLGTLELQLGEARGIDRHVTLARVLQDHDLGAGRQQL
jgi:hypothetical protein